MLVLAWFASLNMSGQIDYIPVPAHPRGFDNVGHDGHRLDADDDLALPEPRGW
jgi:hypothetical protein